VPSLSLRLGPSHSLPPSLGDNVPRSVSSEKFKFRTERLFVLVWFLLLILLFVALGHDSVGQVFLFLFIFLFIFLISGQPIWPLIIAIDLVSDVDVDHGSNGNPEAEAICEIT